MINEIEDGVMVDTKSDFKNFQKTPQKQYRRMQRIIYDIEYIHQTIEEHNFITESNIQRVITNINNFIRDFSFDTSMEKKDVVRQLLSDYYLMNYLNGKKNQKIIIISI